MQTPCGKDCEQCEGLQLANQRLHRGDIQLERIPAIERKLQELITSQKDQQKISNRQQEVLTQLTEGLSKVSTSVSSVVDTTKAIKDMLDVWDTVKGAGRVITWVAAAAKVLTPIAIFLTFIAIGYQWLKIKLGLSEVLP